MGYSRLCRIKALLGNMLFFFVMLPAHFPDPERLFRLHNPADIIAQCVHWYQIYLLSLHNLKDMMTERSIELVQMICKEQLHHPADDILLSAEQCCLLAA